MTAVMLGEEFKNRHLSTTALSVLNVGCRYDAEQIFG
jgi:hypothetical protein